MRLAEFKAMTSARPPPADLRLFVNPRNAAAGALRQKDPARDGQPSALLLGLPGGPGRGGAERQSLAVSRHAVGHLGPLGPGWSPRQPRCPAWSPVSAAVIARCEELAAERHDLDYEIDGAVVKIDELALHAALGATS